MSWQDDYIDRYYRSRPGYVDGTTEYWGLVRTHAAPDGEVLELGCGPANRTSEFLAENFAAVDGLDIDEACRDNPSLRRAYVYDGKQWPVPDGSYDAVVANYVLEHVEHPIELVREIKRVLRPAGVFVFRAPNRWHYVSLASRLTPHFVHEKLANRLRNFSEDAHDPYPTFYRMNSAGALKRLFANEGFEQREMRAIEKEPFYGLSLKPLFLLFMLYERIVNSTAALAWARANLLGVFKKRPS